MTTRTIHAPSQSFVYATTTRTVPVTTVPKPLMNTEIRQPLLRSRSQRRTRPLCESVNATNTPIVYSGTSLLTLPSNATRTRPATIASARMPNEKARRSPRNANWRGMKRSSASTDARRGNPVNPVLAASARMIAVEICTTK